MADTLIIKIKENEANLLTLTFLNLSLLLLNLFFLFYSLFKKHYF